MTTRAKRFIAQQGSNNTIKVFNAETGTLFKVINVGGSIVSPPVVSGSEVTVTVKVGNTTMAKIFNLPGGGLRNSIVL